MTLIIQIEHQCIKERNDDKRQLFTKEDKFCNPTCISDYFSSTYMKNVYVCIYGKIHICEAGRCTSGMQVGHHRTTLCKVSGLKRDGFSIFDRDKQETYGEHAINNQSKVINDKGFHEMNKNNEKIADVSLFEFIASFGTNDFTMSQLSKYIKEQTEIIQEKVDKGIYYLDIIKKERKKRAINKLDRKKKTYSATTSSRRRTGNQEKHHNIGFTQPKSSSKTPSRQERRNTKIKTFSAIINILKKEKPWTHINEMNKPYSKNTDYWYLDFLLGNPFNKIIELDRNSELTLRAPEYHPDNLFPRNKEHKMLFIEGVKIIKSLCPGLYRLKIEMTNILKICKQKKKKLNSILDYSLKQNIMPNYFELKEHSMFDYWNYKQILTETISDDEVLECVRLMIWFWDRCKESLYMKKQGVQCMNVTNHCISILYIMRTGLQMNDHTIIPKNYKFSQRGYLTDLNSINNYGYTRKNHSNGHKLFLSCINSLLETKPIYEIKPFAKKL